MTSGEIAGVKAARKLAVFVRDWISTPPGRKHNGFEFEEGGTLWQRADQVVRALDKILGNHGIL